MAANHRDPWGFHHTIFGANGWPVAKIEVEAKPKQPIRRWQADETGAKAEAWRETGKPLASGERARAAFFVSATL